MWTSQSGDELLIHARYICVLAFCSHVLTSMMTSSNGNIFRVTGHLCGEFTGPGDFPAQRPVTRSFDVFFYLRPNERLSKQPWGWWFETPSWSLWRHGNYLTDGNTFRPMCKPKQTVEQAVELPVIWVVLTLRWRHFNENVCAMLRRSFDVIMALS